MLMGPVDLESKQLAAIESSAVFSQSRSDRSAEASRSSLVLPLFGVTLFLGSFLLFVVEPMVARLVLPVLGGVPMVWNTCVVFFQIMLLAGYGYAFGASKWVDLRRHAVAHSVILLIPFAVLPLALQPGASPPPNSNPIPWLLLVLATTVGLPFFVVSTSASVIQHWFSRTDHRAARDPYFLYASSNMGSLLALAAYPAIVEPTLTLGEQGRLWTIGYAVLVALTWACAAAVWRDAGIRPTVQRATDATATTTATVGIGAFRRARWVLLSFIPSSLMLAVTSYLTTDIAAVPLLWTVPLGLYLLTFVLAFGSRGERMRALALRVWPLVVAPLALLMIAQIRGPFLMVLLLHLVGFTIAALQCHGELAHDRPDPSHLTEFYFWISLGGLIGGLFNTLAAPLLFTGIIEYPLVLVLACLIRRNISSQVARARSFAADLIVPITVAAVMAAIMILGRRLGVASGVLFLMLSIPALTLFTQRQRSLPFGLSLAAMFVVGSLAGTATEPVLHAERTFFGVYRVMVDRTGAYRALAHGTTLHGMQAIDPAHRHEPLTYFHRSGPIGEVFTGLPHVATAREVAVVGLGIGTMASYARPGQQWTLYEIDPAVERIARTSSYFTFLDDCGGQCRLVLGDGRLSLKRAQPGQYGLVVLDAFSSDAVPIHLITDEALSLYLSRLEPGGALVFNISNRHVALNEILARLAEHHHLVAIERLDLNNSSAPWPAGKTQSHWIVMARTRNDLGALANDARWTTPVPSPSTPLWTDDFSNILSALSFR
jgi:hypothetical protein